MRGKKIWNPKVPGNLHSRASSRHSFRLSERHTRLRHALVANNQGLAALDVQGARSGLFPSFSEQGFCK